MNIVLTGFMGTGKTSAAKIISGAYGFEFADTDMLIVSNEKKSINDIFKTCGEAYFRGLESELIDKLYKKDNLVISTGGGIILNEANAVKLSKNGMIFYLTASPDIILKRIRGNTERPLLMVDNPKSRISSLMAQRDALYRKHADYIIDTDNKDIIQTAEAVYNIFTKNK